MRFRPRNYQIETLYCSRCQTDKPKSDFALQTQRSRGYQSMCVECKRKDDSERYERDKARIRARNDAWAETNAQLIREAKSRPCMDCDKPYPSYVMDFDHVRGKKLIMLSRARWLSPDKIRAEIEKCDVVCANCHRERTFSRACSSAE